MPDFLIRSAPEERLPSFAEYSARDVAYFPSPSGRLLVLERSFETLGYREIRVFVQVSVDHYEVHPLALGSASLTLGFYHTTELFSALYGVTRASAAVTRSVDLVATQKVFGATTRILLTAEHLPPGPYSVDVTCYLLP